MRDLLDQIERSLDANLYLLALMATLTIPDMAGALESSNGEATSARYIDWYNRNVHAAYTQDQFLDGAACWDFRCSVLHQGRSTLKRRRHRVAFIDPDPLVIDHLNVYDDLVMIDCPQFCRDMISAARQWLRTVENTEPFQTNLKRSVQRYPDGIATVSHLVGVPVIY